MNCSKIFIILTFNIYKKTVKSSKILKVHNLQLIISYNLSIAQIKIY